MGIIRIPLHVLATSLLGVGVLVAIPAVVWAGGIQDPSPFGGGGIWMQGELMASRPGLPDCLKPGGDLCEVTCEYSTVSQPAMVQVFRVGKN